MDSLFLFLSAMQQAQFRSTVGMFELVLSDFNLICFPLAQLVVVSPDFKLNMVKCNRQWLKRKQQLTRKVNL